VLFAAAAATGAGTGTGRSSSAAATGSASSSAGTGLVGQVERKHSILGSSARYRTVIEPAFRAL